jgi:hypothetical protein
MPYWSSLKKTAIEVKLLLGKMFNNLNAAGATHAADLGSVCPAWRTTKG